MKFQVECNECYTIFMVEVLDGDADTIECCPFCNDKSPIVEEIDEE